MAELLVKLSESLVDSDAGVNLLLLVLSGLLGWAYWMEKRKNEKLNSDRLEEMKTTTQELTEALHQSNAAIEQFSQSNAALKQAFEILMRTQGDR